MVSAPPAPNVVVEIEEPIVAELFSADRLEQHAESLAAAQTVASSAEGGPSLIDRTEENARSLLEYYRATARALQREQIITPAEQWLVENFYIVEDQLREIRDDLPIGYYRRLPKLASGHLAGYPRVYGIAWAFVAHTDSRLDPHVLRRFINAYQRVQPLSMGELWAVAITLRIVLVENLRRLAGRIVFSRQARHQADQLADALLGTGGQSALSPAAALRQFEKKPLDRAFAVQLIQRLRDLDPKVGPILLWLDERLAAQGTTADDIVRAEHQQQAAMSVTVRNVITSMRWTSAVRLAHFFRKCEPGRPDPSKRKQLWRDGLRALGMPIGMPSRIFPGGRNAPSLRLRIWSCGMRKKRHSRAQITIISRTTRRCQTRATTSSRRDAQLSNARLDFACPKGARFFAGTCAPPCADTLGRLRFLPLLSWPFQWPVRSSWACASQTLSF